MIKTKVSDNKVLYTPPVEKVSKKKPAVLPKKSKKVETPIDEDVKEEEVEEVQFNS